MTIHVSEFKAIKAWGRLDIPDVKQAPFAVPGISLPTTQSYVRIMPRVDVLIEFGAAPVASVSSELFLAGVEYVRILPLGTILAAIATIAAPTVQAVSTEYILNPNDPNGFPIIDNIGGIPPGVTPLFNPNDGRAVISGNQVEGWDLVKGPATSVDGQTINGTLIVTGEPDVSIIIRIIAS